MRGDPFGESDPYRVIETLEGVTVEIGEPEHSSHLVGVDWAHVIESNAEETFGGFVVIEEVAGLVHEPYRHSQVAGQLTKEDHLDWLLVPWHRGELSSSGCKM